MYKGNSMANVRYQQIYSDLKSDILKGLYARGDLLPSEQQLTKKYGVARNTIRRSINILTNEGYVQPIHGKGVVVINEQVGIQQAFTLDGIETFGEIAKKSNRNIITKVVEFKETICDRKLSDMTGFDEGMELIYIERVRIMDELKLIYDINIYRKDLVPGLNRQIAEDSIYSYIENTLGMIITISKRRFTAEKATPKDKYLLDLKGFDFLAVVTGQVFNSDGVMFEYTQSRHRPDHFCFTGNSIRTPRK